MDREAQEMVEMLRAILASIDEGIHAVDRDGITIYYNDSAAKLDGLDPQEVIGRHLLEVFPSLQTSTSTLLKVIDTGERIPDMPQMYTNYRGTKVHTVNTTLPIMSSGRLIGALEVAKDLTRLKELNEKLVDLQAQIVSMERGTGKKKSPIEARWTFAQILTQERSMLLLKELAARAATTSSPVLVFGETGTGKELFVQSIHNASPRRNRPFIAQNCAALPASLLEGLLFGTVKGSFTGAENRPGLFELADGGTLFLDEINSMPLELQAKLLRVLQEGIVRRVGDAKVIEVDVRVLAATNQNPIVAIERGNLRADLYYRLNVVSLHLPRLSERPDDIRLLTKHFIEKFNRKFGRAVVDVTPEVFDRFVRYEWPGNVRELEHAIEGAMNIADGPYLQMEHLPWHIREGHFSAKQEGDFSLPHAVRPLREALDQVETALIEQAMRETNGNIQQAAKLLQVPRQTLQYRLNKAQDKEGREQLTKRSASRGKADM
ncbi:sigma-54 interaction domain-containing protein [Tumebacillus lipolyticus]|uniref:Sigma-54 interaction domain-containing protein n=1 Tax=Tumebacillus lipolyticus TaxID=1280370 RepID=A0ABW4ZXG8_9BACL